MALWCCFKNKNIVFLRLCRKSRFARIVPACLNELFTGMTPRKYRKATDFLTSFPGLLKIYDFHEGHPPSCLMSFKQGSQIGTMLIFYRAVSAACFRSYPACTLSSIMLSTISLILLTIEAR